MQQIANWIKGHKAWSAVITLVLVGAVTATIVLWPHPSNPAVDTAEAAPVVEAPQTVIVVAPPSEDNNRVRDNVVAVSDDFPVEAEIPSTWDEICLAADLPAGCSPEDLGNSDWDCTVTPAEAWTTYTYTEAGAASYNNGTADCSNNGGEVVVDYTQTVVVPVDKEVGGEIPLGNPVWIMVTGNGQVHAMDATKDNGNHTGWSSNPLDVGPGNSVAAHQANQIRKDAKSGAVTTTIILSGDATGASNVVIATEAAPARTNGSDKSPEWCAAHPNACK